MLAKRGVGVEQLFAECIWMAFVGLLGAGGGAAVVYRPGQGIHQFSDQLRVLGLQVVLLGGITLKVV